MAESLTPAELEILADSVARKVAEKLIDQPRLVSREQIAIFTSISVPTVDRMTRSGEIPCIRRGSRVLYDPADVIAAMKRRGDA